MFTLDVSKQSLEHALIVVQFFANISGLRVNVDKTSVIWFGSIKNSEITFCDEYNLYWEAGNFTLLGISVSINLEQIVEINYEIKLAAVESVFKSWSKRILTPLEKKCCYKMYRCP